MDEISGRPSNVVMAEFKTVARKSTEFLAALTKSNRKPEYCPDQVDEICKTLITLPDVTTPDGREILDYAGKRLPDLRREMFPFDDPETESGGSSSRDDSLDDKFSLLIAAVTTALATIDREAGNRPEPEPPPVYVSNQPPSNANTELAHEADNIAKQLDQTGKQIKEIDVAESPRIERLRRTIQGTAGLHVLARSELLFREVVPGWLRKLKGAIGKTPQALRAAQRGINLAVDIAKPFYDQSKKVWDDLEDLGAKHIKLFADNLGKAADTIEQSNKGGASSPPPAVGPYDAAEARAMIQRGEAPPAEWVPYITNLDFVYEMSLANAEPLRGLVNLITLWLSDTQITSAEPLKGLVNLTSLALSNTQITSAEPLKGLENLKELWLSNTQITSAEPLKGLVNLTSLGLNNTQITSAEPLKGLVNLKELWLHNTQIKSAEPLKGLVNLTTLSLENTPITDVRPLRGLPRLARIDVQSLKRAKAVLPQLGEGWRIKRKNRNEAWYELRRDVPGVKV